VPEQQQRHNSFCWNAFWHLYQLEISAGLEGPDELEFGSCRGEPVDVAHCKW
jgi:hypothetical protein